jgi:hypothetical protein
LLRAYGLEWKHGNRFYRSRWLRLFCPDSNPKVTERRSQANKYHDSGH